MSEADATLGSHRLTPESDLQSIPLRDDCPATWGDSVGQWRQYVCEKEDEYLVFLGKAGRNEGEIMTAPYSHRFQQEYTKMQYAKIQDFIRGGLSEYDDPYLVVLTFSTTTTTLAGEPRPPLDQMDELLDAWTAEERCARAILKQNHRVEDCPGCLTERVRCEAVGTRGHSVEDCPDCRTEKVRCEVCTHTIEDCPDCCNGVYDELTGSLEGREWEYLTVLEPTTDKGMVPGGYPHQHVGIVVDGEVSPELFESVIDRHLRLCDGAMGEAHEMDSVVEVKEAEELGNPGAYLFKYLGKSWDVEEMEGYEKRFSALLFEEGRQRLRASNGAQRWMQRDEDESGSGDWIFAGIGDSELVLKLNEYDDYEDFLIATDADGLRSWLARRRGVGVDRDVVEEKKERQRNRITEVEVATRMRAGVPMPWEGDRPPPG